ncbi:hypothetical protein BGZ70_005165, partial [Mortierella alpina]
MLKVFNAAEEKRRIAVEKARQKAISEAKRRGQVEARIKKICGPSLDINARQSVIRRLVEKARLIARKHAQKTTSKVASKLSKDKDKDKNKSRSTPSSAAGPGSASASASTRPSATHASKPKDTKGSITKPPTKEQQELIDVFLSEYVRVVALRLQPCAPGALQFMLMGGIMGEIEPLFLKSWDGAQTVRSNVSAFLDKGLASGQITPADARQLMQYFDEIPADRKKWTPWELGGFVAGGIGAVGMGSRTYGSWGMGGDVLGESDSSPFAGGYLSGLDSDFEDEAHGGYHSEGGSVPDWETVTEDEDHEDDESSAMDSDDDVPDAETATEDEDEDEDEEEEDDSSDVPDWESMTESEDDDSDDGAGATTGRASHGQGRAGVQKDAAQGSARGQGTTSKQSSSNAGSSSQNKKRKDEEDERNRRRNQAELENQAREAEADKL